MLVVVNKYNRKLLLKTLEDRLRGLEWWIKDRRAEDKPVPWRPLRDKGALRRMIKQLSRKEIPMDKQGGGTR